MLNPLEINQKIKFIISGVVSTLIHFLFLLIGVEIIKISLISISNLFASFFGLSSSFILNRYFVFRKFNKDILITYIQFMFANTLTIIVTSLLFLLWSDILGWDYRIGFLLIYLFIAIINFYLYKKIIFN